MKYEIVYSQRVYWNFVVDFTEKRWMEYLDPDLNYTAEDLQEFIKLDSMKLFWSNRAGRVLLVTSLTNLGSMAGAWIAAPLIAAGL